MADASGVLFTCVLPVNAPELLGLLKQEVQEGFPPWAASRLSSARSFDLWGRLCTDSCIMKVLRCMAVSSIFIYIYIDVQKVSPGPMSWGVSCGFATRSLFVSLTIQLDLRISQTWWGIWRRFRESESPPESDLQEVLDFLGAKLLVEGSSGDVIQCFGPANAEIQLRMSNESWINMLI